jgi:RNA polymerase sigma-70 factor, ECF subfamily
MGEDGLASRALIPHWSFQIAQGVAMIPPGGREFSRSISSTLLAGVRAGQSAAWERLVDVWGPLIYGWCRREGLQASDAQDVVQVVLAKIFLNLPTFRRESFRRWVSSITRNEIIDRYRGGLNQPEPIGGSSANQFIQTRADPKCTAPGNNETEPPDHDTNSLLARRVLDVIRTDFSEKTFQAFWRTAVDGLSAPEVAKELRMTPEAVRQAKRRVLERVRGELDAFGVPMPATLEKKQRPKPSAPP